MLKTKPASTNTACAAERHRCSHQSQRIQQAPRAPIRCSAAREKRRPSRCCATAVCRPHLLSASLCSLSLLHPSVTILLFAFASARPLVDAVIPRPAMGSSSSQSNLAAAFFGGREVACRRRRSAAFPLSTRRTILCFVTATAASCSSTHPREVRPLMEVESNRSRRFHSHFTSPLFSAPRRISKMSPVAASSLLPHHRSEQAGCAASSFFGHSLPSQPLQQLRSLSSHTDRPQCDRPRCCTLPSTLRGRVLQNLVAPSALTRQYRRCSSRRSIAADCLCCCLASISDRHPAVSRESGRHQFSFLAPDRKVLLLLFSCTVSEAMQAPLSHFLSSALSAPALFALRPHPQPLLSSLADHLSREQRMEQQQQPSENFPCSVTLCMDDGGSGGHLAAAIFSFTAMERTTASEHCAPAPSQARRCSSECESNASPAALGSCVDNRRSDSSAIVQRMQQRTESGIVCSGARARNGLLICSRVALRCSSFCVLFSVSFSVHAALAPFRRGSAHPSFFLSSAPPFGAPFPLADLL